MAYIAIHKHTSTVRNAGDPQYQKDNDMVKTFDSGNKTRGLSEVTKARAYAFPFVDDSKDVRLPIQMQRAMAAEAEASREARAKVCRSSQICRRFATMKNGYLNGRLLRHGWQQTWLPVLVPFQSAVQLSALLSRTYNKDSLFC